MYGRSIEVLHFIWFLIRSGFVNIKTRIESYGFVGDDSKIKILGPPMIKFLLKDGKFKILLRFLHILNLSKNIDNCKYDRWWKYAYFIWKGHIQDGSRRNGVYEGSSYWNFLKYIGKKFNDGCTSYIIHEDRIKEYQTHIVLMDKTILWP